MIGRALTWWIDKIARLAWAVVIMALAVTAAALYYTASRLVINTDTADMIAPEVPFRRNNEAFAREFPQFRDTIVIVIDGGAPEDTAQASERLAAWLADQETVFRDVYYPSGDAFFQRNGLLYTDYDELTEFADRLAGAEPLLATLARDPSLRGLAEVIDLAIADADAGSAAQLAELFDAMATVATNLSGGRAGALSWERLFAGDDGIDARQLIVVQPVLDYGSFKPAAAALAAIRLGATDLDIGPAHGATLRLTGSVALDHEELESVELGGRTAGLLSLALVTALLALCLRSVRLVIAVVATLLMGLVWTAAFATLAVGQLNLISVAFAVLFIGLGVDFGIHMALRFREELTRDGDRTAALGARGPRCRRRAYPERSHRGRGIFRLSADRLSRAGRVRADLGWRHVHRPVRELVGAAGAAGVAAAAGREIGVRRLSARHRRTQLRQAHLVGRGVPGRGVGGGRAVAALRPKSAQPEGSAQRIGDGVQ